MIGYSAHWRVLKRMRAPPPHPPTHPPTHLPTPLLSSPCGHIVHPTPGLTLYTFLLFSFLFLTLCAHAACRRGDVATWSPRARLLLFTHFACSLASRSAAHLCC